MHTEGGRDGLHANSKTQIYHTLFNSLKKQKQKKDDAEHLGCLIVTKEMLLRHQIYIVMKLNIWVDLYSVSFWNHASEMCFFF